MLILVIRNPSDGRTNAREFFADFPGLSTEEFNLGWVARYTSSETVIE